MEKPIFRIKPNIFASMFFYFFVVVFVSIFMGIFFAGGMESALIGIIAGVIAFFLFIFLRFMSLKATHYLFYKDRIEYFEGFLNQEKRTLPYTKITDCVLTKSVLQRMFNVGTIALLTAGQQGVGRMTVYGGVRLISIDDCDQFYEKLMDLLKLKK